MSLPTNSGLAKQKGCSPVSSNCVVWQGPDLDCIGLCKGDSISDVVYKMAQELCTLIELFNLEDYDFSCLAIPNSENPNDFKDLIQILIERVCALEGIDPTDTGSGTDCPENCVVPIADCFYTVSDNGDTITTLSLTDYVNAIGLKICEILDSITIIQNEIITLQTDVTDTQNDIVTLDTEKASIASLQYQVNVKTNPAGPTEYVTDALRDVENSLIVGFDALGSSTKMYSGIIKAGTIGEEDRLSADGLMSSIPGWTLEVGTLAESLGNAWLVLADLRDAVEYIQDNCCVTGCTDLFLNFRVTLDVTISTTFINVFTSNSTGFTDAWAECNVGGTNIVVTDALGNSTSFKVDVIALIDQPNGIPFDLTATSIDPTVDVTAVAETCFINEQQGVTCEKDYTDTVFSVATCPATILTIFTNSINYQFTAVAGLSYIANVYIAGAPTPIISQVIATPGAVVFNSIPGLTPAIDYEFEVVTVNGEKVENPCPKQAFTTLPNNCTPPINVVAVLTI